MTVIKLESQSYDYGSEADFEIEKKPMSFLYAYVVRLWIRLVVVTLLVLIQAIRWINEYRKNQIDCDNYLERQLEILKYKNEKNKQKGNYDTKS